MNSVDVLKQRMHKEYFALLGWRAQSADHPSPRPGDQLRATRAPVAATEPRASWLCYDVYFCTVLGVLTWYIQYVLYSSLMSALRTTLGA